MFGPFGGPELLLILVLALIVFGPRKLPEIGKSLGRMIGEFRRASTELKRTIEDEVEADRLRELSTLTPADAAPPSPIPPTEAPIGPEPAPEAPAPIPATPPPHSNLD